MEETSRGCGAGGASRNKRKPAAELPEGGEGAAGARSAGRLPAALGRGRQRDPARGSATMTSAILRRNSSKQGLQNLIR